MEKRNSSKKAEDKDETADHRVDAGQIDLGQILSIAELSSPFPKSNSLHGNKTMLANGCLQGEVQGLQNRLSSTLGSARSTL